MIHFDASDTFVYLRYIWIHLGKIGYIWIHLKKNRIHLDISRKNRILLDTSRKDRIHFDTSDTQISCFIEVLVYNFRPQT